MEDGGCSGSGDGESATSARLMACPPGSAFNAPVLLNTIASSLLLMDFVRPKMKQTTVSRNTKITFTAAAISRFVWVCLPKTIPPIIYRVTENYRMPLIGILLPAYAFNVDSHYCDRRKMLLYILVAFFFAAGIKHLAKLL